MERPATVCRSSHIVVTKGAQGPHDAQAALQEVALMRRLTVNHQEETKQGQCRSALRIETLEKKKHDPTGFFFFTCLQPPPLA